MSRSAVVLVALTLFASACTTDEKGGTCGFLDAYISSSDELYCPDPAAPDDCAAFVDTLFARTAECAQEAGFPLDEEELRAELESRGSVPDCDAAVATTTSYEACIDHLESDAACNGDGTLEPSDSCTGAVLVSR